MTIKKCMIAHDCDNMVNDYTAFPEWECFRANCTTDLGSEVVGCIGECIRPFVWLGSEAKESKKIFFQNCAEDCEDSNGVQGIQATQFTMLLVTVFAMFMVAKILFKWRINSF